MNNFIKEQQELARGKYIDSKLGMNEITEQELDTLIQQTITNTGAEIMRRVEEEKGKWVAAYTPATDGRDPSKWGFKTEKEAWGWINKQGCKPDCEMCEAEWMVYRIEEVDQALDTIKQHIKDLIEEL